MDKIKIGLITRKLSRIIFQSLCEHRDIGIINNSNSKDLILTFDGVAYLLKLEPLENVEKEPEQDVKYQEKLFELSKKYLQK